MTDRYARTLAMAALAKAEKAGKAGTQSSGTFKVLTDGVRRWKDRTLSMTQNCGGGIVGADGYYFPEGYNTIMVIPFDETEQYRIHTQHDGSDYSSTHCWIQHIAYGNGLYLGINNVEGKAYTSTDAKVWKWLSDVHIDLTTITRVDYVDGDFVVRCSDGVYGKCASTESYNRIYDASGEFTALPQEVQTMHTFLTRGNHEFYLTESCIVWGSRLEGYNYLPFTEELPDDVYNPQLVAFWNGYMFMMDYRYPDIIYMRPARVPNDLHSGYFAETGWMIPMRTSPNDMLQFRAVCAVGDYLYIFTVEKVLRVDKNWDVTTLVGGTREEPDLTMGYTIDKVLVAGNSILVCGGSSAWQFYLE